MLKISEKKKKVTKIEVKKRGSHKYLQEICDKKLFKKILFQGTIEI